MYRLYKKHYTCRVGRTCRTRQARLCGVSACDICHYIYDGLESGGCVLWGAFMVPCRACPLDGISPYCIYAWCSTIYAVEVPAYLRKVLRYAFMRRVHANHAPAMFSRVQRLFARLFRKGYFSICITSTQRAKRERESLVTHWLRNVKCQMWYQQPDNLLRDEGKHYPGWWNLCHSNG